MNTFRQLQDLSPTLKSKQGPRIGGYGLESSWLVLALAASATVLGTGCTFRFSQSPDASAPSEGLETNDTDLKLVNELKGEVANTSTRWLEYGPEEKATEDYVEKSLTLFKRNRKLHAKTYSEIASSLPAATVANQRHKEMIGLIYLDGPTWIGFVELLANKGYPNQGITNSLPQLLKRLPEETKQEIYTGMGALYVKAYRTKYNLPAANAGPYGAPMAPKRALDAILRFMVPLEEFFESVNSPEEALTAYEKHLALLREIVLKGTDHGQYEATDVIGVSRYVQKAYKEVMKSIKISSTDERNTFQQVLLKGSFPSGRANLVRRSPWDNPIETILHGVKTSYSDIDLNVGPAEAMGAMKEWQAQAWSGLQSSLAKNQAVKTKAQADFQMHPRDPYGELHGSRLSPVGVRITPSSIKLVVYSSFRLGDLPPKKQVEEMSFEDQEKLLSKFSVEFEMPAESP